MYAKWGSGYAWSGEPQARWKTCMLGPIHVWDAVWRQKVCRTFPRLKSDQKAQGRRQPMGETPFFRECRVTLRNLPESSDLSWPRKQLYRELGVETASEPLSERHGWTAEEVYSHWNWAPVSSFLNNPSSRSPSGLYRTHCPFSAWTSEHVWQICQIVLAASVA